MQSLWVVFNLRGFCFIRINLTPLTILLLLSRRAKSIFDFCFLVLRNIKNQSDLAARRARKALRRSLAAARFPPGTARARRAAGGDGGRNAERLTACAALGPSGTAAVPGAGGPSERGEARKRGTEAALRTKPGWKSLIPRSPVICERLLLCAVTAGAFREEDSPREGLGLHTTQVSSHRITSEG